MILEILNELESVSGKKDKLVILEREKDNDLLRDVFHAALNRTINYYIKKIPEGCMEESANCKLGLDWAIGELDALSNRDVTGQAAKEHLVDIFNKLDYDDAEVLSRIIKRDMRCGVQTQVDKVWKGLIPEIPKMLAMPMKKKNLDKIKYPAIAQLKSDGARCFAVVQNGDVTLYSRNYKEYQDLDTLKESILEFLSYHPNGWSDCVLDGELLLKKPDGSYEERKVGNGIINKSTKGTISKEEADRVVLMTWDLVTHKEYFEGKLDIPYESRLHSMKNHCGENDRVVITETFEVNSLDEAKKIYEMYRDRGEEGILLKNMDSPWEDKRSPNQVKFKAEFHCDVIAKEIIEGDKKYKGMLGAVRCQTRDGLVEFNCGSGFSDKQRKEYYDNPDLILEEVLEVKHNGLIKSKSKDLHSVFLPIFQFVRDDKQPHEADTIDSIEDKDALSM